MLKLIHIGVSTETVVSWLFCGLTYVPSATAAKLRDAVDRRRDRRVREVELRLLELGLALRDGGLRLLVLALRVVEILLRQRVLLGERLGPRRGSPSRPRARPDCAATPRPGASTCAWNGFWSIRNSTWPALTTAPSVYTRLSRKPDTRAAMLTACELCVCATKTEVTGTSRGTIVSAVTSMGGRATSFVASLPQPERRSIAATATRTDDIPRAGRASIFSSVMKGPSGRSWPPVVTGAGRSHFTARGRRLSTRLGR